MCFYKLLSYGVCFVLRKPFSHGLCVLCLSLVTPLVIITQPPFIHCHTLHTFTRSRFMIILVSILGLNHFWTKVNYCEQQMTEVSATPVDSTDTISLTLYAQCLPLDYSVACLQSHSYCHKWLLHCVSAKQICVYLLLMHRKTWALNTSHTHARKHLSSLRFFPLSHAPSSIQNDSTLGSSKYCLTLSAFLRPWLANVWHFSV